MLFNAPDFLLFFLLFFVLHLLVERHMRWRLRLITAASLVFYATWNYKFLSLIVCSGGIDFFCARRIETAQSAGRTGRRWFIASVAMNLALLGIFKYANFFLSSVQQVVSPIYFLELPVLQVVLPVGISFYTFQSMSYTADVYRQRISAEKDFLLFFSYLSFFEVQCL